VCLRALFILFLDLPAQSARNLVTPKIATILRIPFSGCFAAPRRKRSIYKVFIIKCFTNRIAKQFSIPLRWKINTQLALQLFIVIDILGLAGFEPATQALWALSSNHWTIDPTKKSQKTHKKTKLQQRHIEYSKDE
jgi:hypothetical protein